MNNRNDLQVFCPQGAKSTYVAVYMIWGILQSAKRVRIGKDLDGWRL